MTPGQRIKHLRIERGLTLKQAAALTGRQLAHSTWSRIENGVSGDPHPSHKAAIAEALDCKVSAIWPPPQSFEDKADARFRATVRTHAERVERDGSLEERQTFGKRLLTVLERIDRGSRHPDADDGPYEELWKLGLSLMCDPEKRTMHGEVGYLTRATQVRVVDAKRRRIRERGTRAKAHAASTATSPPVTTRRRPRERRDSTRTSSPPGESDEPEPGEARHAHRQGG